MSILKTVLALYAAGALAVAARLAWHMAFRLDKYDWRASKAMIWTAFFVSPIAWPYFLFKPKILVNPSSLFEEPGAIQPASEVRALEKQKADFPPCARNLIYRPRNVYDIETHGEFQFLSLNVQRAFEAEFKSKPIDQNAANFYKWLTQRNDGNTTPSEIPSWWQEPMSRILKKCLSRKPVSVNCLGCGVSIPLDHIRPADGDAIPGWNFHTLVCPRHHVLFATETVHVYVD